MASVRIPALCHLATYPLRAAARLQIQRRWAQVHDVRFLVTKQPPTAVVDKYREKLDKKAKKEGHGSIEDLKSAYADKINAERMKDAVEYPIPTIPQAPETPVSQPNRGPIPSQRASNAAPAPPCASGKAAIQSLDEIVDVEKIRELPQKELTALWRLRHASSPQKLCAVIPAVSYKAMEDMARQSPQFVLPVPHESQGAEIHFLQWTFDAASKTSTVLFTQLAEFKTRGEYAQPHTTVTHHLDLLDDKGLVLMQGHTMEDRGMQPEHAKWLVLCLHRFYGAWESNEAELDSVRKDRADQRKKLVQWFGSGDPRFSIEQLLEESERMA
ncbi:atp11 [Metarhizium rileyi]|uniref:Atp11 n=1 Tax=Metarhizium rileyi (strain RCEF 4871) TaxID=1649241 RepID=A0A167A7E5_METRR|nr:atp11 [Metarhizium rileyi RCEF 4871]TWU73506.1 hypothetical protein ED733_001954 [Metarhizium rileyi]